MATFESATSRLDRLLTMVPWLLGRQGIDLAAAAQQLGVSESQIVDDLQLLFVCGTPGHLPDDLIEAQWEQGKVYVGNADSIARPLRLGRDEALALIVALRALAASPGLAEHDAIDRALAKLEQAAGESAADADAVRVDLTGTEREQEVLALLRQALEGHRRLHLRYVVASRDEATERDVDPMRALNLDGRWYLEGWCHRAQDVRLFRVDRIEHAEVLASDGTPPQQARPRDVAAGAYQGSAQDISVELELSPGAAWVAENFPTERAERHDDGSWSVALRVTDDAWVRRLVWRSAGQVRVRSPVRLVQAVVDGARDVLTGPTRPAGVD